MAHGLLNNPAVAVSREERRASVRPIPRPEAHNRGRSELLMHNPIDRYPLFHHPSQGPKRGAPPWNLNHLPGPGAKNGLACDSILTLLLGPWPG